MKRKSWTTAGLALGLLLGSAAQCSKKAPAGGSPAAANIAVGNAPVLGPADARVTIIEYSDFQ